MKKQLILFVCPGRDSLGELHNAVTAALSATDSFDFEFFVSGRFESYVADNGLTAHHMSRGQDGVAEVLQFVEARRPAHVIIADHHLFRLERTGILIKDFEPIFDSLSSFDSLGLAPSKVELGFALSRLDGAERIARWLPSTLEIDSLPGSIRPIRPVPVANGPFLESFALYPTVPVPQTPGFLVREEFGVPPDALLVVFARSKWAKHIYFLLSMLSRNRGIGASPSDAMVAWIHEAFSRLNRPVVVFGLETSRALPFGSQVTLRSLPLLGMQAFDDLLGASDLYLTDNLVSAAMARAARLGTPCLAMTNLRGQKSADSFSTAWHSRMAVETPGYDFPFIVNPFGWVDELSHLTQDNPYLESVPRVEIFDLDQLTAAIDREVRSTNPAASVALETAYIELRSFEELVHSLIERR